MKIGNLIEYLKEYDPNDTILVFGWHKEDAEYIVDRFISDDDWKVIVKRIENKSGWVHDEIHEEITERYNQVTEERYEEGDE